MEQVTLLQPPKIVFGNGCLQYCIDDVLQANYRTVYILTAPEISANLDNIFSLLKNRGVNYSVDQSVTKEPTAEMFKNSLSAAQKVKPDIIIGIGGGSVLDVAKLTAALLNGKQKIADVYGIGLLEKRQTPVYCLPTTSGTGSEVSPNAILLDQKDNLKKGVISPYLVPDAAYLDPLLTKTVPPAITASTGIDALTHCIEAYVNRYAHPAVDTFALRGIELIGANLAGAVKDGSNESCRENMSLASMYGGLCLGPVNTAAVHALAYPLGSIYHIAHGISNALLLPHVLKFNLPAALKKYAQIATALGVMENQTEEQKAAGAIEKITELLRTCQLPTRLSQLNIPRDELNTLAHSAMTVSRLLKNNIRQITFEDAIHIYQEAY